MTAVSVWTVERRPDAACKQRGAKDSHAGEDLRPPPPDGGTPPATRAPSGSQVKALALGVTSCSGAKQIKQKKTKKTLQKGAQQNYAHLRERIRLVPCWLI